MSESAEPGKPLSDADMVRVLTETFGILDRWQFLVRSRVEPAENSDLAADDEVWPWARPSTLCLVSLGNATEHLHAVRLLVKSGELFPAATSTLARSALIGGANAVWMLGPDDSTQRRRRMLSLAFEDYRQHIAFGTESIRAMQPDDLHPSAGEQMERLRTRQRGIETLLADLGGRVGMVVTSDVLPRAIEETTPDVRQRAQLASRWRLMSGAAHGLVWHFFGHDGVSVARLDSYNVGEVSVGGDTSRLFMDYMTAFHVTSRGWNLLGLRAGWPTLT